MRKPKNKKKIRENRKLKRLGQEIANSPPAKALTTTCPKCYSLAILDNDAFLCGKCNVRFSIKIEDKDGTMRCYPSPQDL